MAHRPPLVLLPPSEGKATGGTGPAWAPGASSGPELDDRRRVVMDALARAMRGSQAARAKLLGVKGEALAAATAADVAVAGAPTMAAIDRYTGVLYGALDHRSRSAGLRRRIDRQVRIFSGLWGVVAPPDPVPDYKLKMGASLPRLGRLATWWRPAVTAALADDVRGRIVWDLLPHEHRAAWAPDLDGGPDSPAAVITVHFADRVLRGGGRELVRVAHWNKLLKGALVAHVLAGQLTDVEELAAFEHPQGYRFAPDLTEMAGDGIRIAVTFVRDA